MTNKFITKVYFLSCDGISIYGFKISFCFISDMNKKIVAFSKDTENIEFFYSESFNFFLTGYSASALLAIIFAIPFGRRLLNQEDNGRWKHLGEAFYTAHFELFLGNACLGTYIYYNFLTDLFWNDCIMQVSHVDF